jgi:transmembrane sensor
MRDESSEAGPVPAEQDEWEAVARVLAGESPDDETRRVRRWLDARPADAAFVAAVARLAPPASAAATDVDVEAALRRVHDRLHATGVRPLRPHGTPARRRWPAIALPALAVAAVLLVAVLVWRGARTVDAEVRTVATAVGQRDSLRLPDGSRVVLGPGSRLAVAAGFGGERREVALRGEAYFEVVHDDGRPFVVHAGSATVRDVGTAFTVRSADAGDVRVAVTEGVVLLGAASAGEAGGVRLEAGDRGVLRPGAPPEVARGAVTDDDLAWTRGRLVFRDAALPEVSAALRRWYGVELRVEGATLAARHLTAEFGDEPVERVLEVLGLALGADVERRGDTATLRPR